MQLLDVVYFQFFVFSELLNLCSIIIDAAGSSFSCFASSAGLYFIL